MLERDKQTRCSRNTATALLPSSETQQQEDDTPTTHLSIERETTLRAQHGKVSAGNGHKPSWAQQALFSHIELAQENASIVRLGRFLAVFDSNEGV